MRDEGKGSMPKGEIKVFTSGALAKGKNGPAHPTEGLEMKFGKGDFFDLGYKPASHDQVEKMFEEGKRLPSGKGNIADVTRAAVAAQVKGAKGRG